jgi:uncharacterized protein YbjT (DUF2867 family)
MNILLTGATGYIAKKLIPILLKDGHSVICCVRDAKRFDKSRYPLGRISVVEVNFCDKDTLSVIPKDIDVAYYLIHSMSSSISNFDTLEVQCAENFRDYIQQTNVQQVIYLSGIVNNKNLSKHLSSRKAVEDILSTGSFNLTTLKAGIIIGSGSASFEIIRDLVEKLPIMIAPKWICTKSQPISIRNVVEYLTAVLLHSETFNKSFDIGGPEILTYKEMLLRFAAIRNLKRRIIVVPVMTPKLSSYWLFFITSTSYKLAVNLVNSMKIEVICEDNELQSLLKINLIPFDESIRLAFDKIEQQMVFSSWTDALSNNALEKGVSQLINIPYFGCYKDVKTRSITNEEKIVEKIWAIGGENGWYYAYWLWKLRGFFDKLFGGVGLRRGRKNKTKIHAGDALDFWRVIYANKEEKRLVLYAEMKLPGEAWLEFKISNKKLYQTATFRPKGVFGRLYWIALLPLHAIIFTGMIKKIRD